MPSKDNIKLFDSKKAKSSSTSSSKKKTAGSSAKKANIKRLQEEIEQERMIDKLRDEQDEILANRAKKNRQKTEKEKEEQRREAKRIASIEAKERKAQEKAEKKLRKKERIDRMFKAQGNTTKEVLSDKVIDDCIGVIFIGVGIYVFMCLINVSTGVFGDIVNQVVHGLFGYLAYLLPVLIIAGGVFSILGKSVNLFKMFVCLFAFAFLAAWLQLFPYEAGKFQDDSVMMFLKSTYNKGLDSVGTGVLFSIATYGAKLLFGWAGAKLILFFLLIGTVLLLINRSITKITMRAVESFREKNRERKEKEREFTRSGMRTVNGNNHQRTASQLNTQPTNRAPKINQNSPVNSQPVYYELPLVKSKKQDGFTQTEENESSLPINEAPVYFGKSKKHSQEQSYQDYEEEQSYSYEQSDYNDENIASTDENMYEPPFEEEAPAEKSKIISFFGKKNNPEQEKEYDGYEENAGSEDEYSEDDRPTITEMAEITGEKRKPNVTVDGEILDDGSVESIAAPVDEKKRHKQQYIFPSLDLLEKPQNVEISPLDEEEVYAKARAIEKTLADFGIGGKVNNVTHGPVITRYEYSVPSGTKMSKVTSLDKELSYSLETSSIRIEAPIPGKAAIGIEVPNKTRTTVYMRELLESEEFRKKDSLLAFVVGKDIAGNIIIGDISKMPHTLISGATGSGKSVFINSIILSILYKASPNDVKLIMVDPKKVEFEKYKGIPHLMFPVVSNPKRASGVLAWCVKEMEDRYEKMAKCGVRDLRRYNQIMKKDPSDDPDLQPLPLIVIIIDELSDLMVVAGDEVEDSIYRLAQMARAAGMYLLIATQRPSVDVVTGVIKANIPSRIALKVASPHDSRTIIDSIGAEQLLGNGDMIYKPAGLDRSLRVQGAWVSDDEIENVVDFIRSQNYVSEEVVQESLEDKITEIDKKFVDAANTDEFLEEAIAFVVKEQEASVSMLQRRFRIGHGRAGNLIDEMEKRGIVGPHIGSKSREVLVSKDEYDLGFTSEDKDY